MVGEMVGEEVRTLTVTVGRGDDEGAIVGVPTDIETLENVGTMVGGTDGAVTVIVGNIVGAVNAGVGEIVGVLVAVERKEI